MEQLGEDEKAQEFYKDFFAYTNQNQSLYRDLNYAAYYATIGDIEKAIAHLKPFTLAEGYQYWLVIFLDQDPILNRMSHHPDYAPTIKLIRDNFWLRHKKLHRSLEEDGVI